MGYAFLCNLPSISYYEHLQHYSDCLTMSPVLFFCSILISLFLISPTSTKSSSRTTSSSSISSESSSTPAGSLGRGKRATFLDQLCDKCDYCKKDPTCSGCAKCEQCTDKSQPNCRFCKAGETTKKCEERCMRGCNICKGKSGKGLKKCLETGVKIDL